MFINSDAYKLNLQFPNTPRKYLGDNRYSTLNSILNLRNHRLQESPQQKLINARKIQRHREYSQRFGIKFVTPKEEYQPLRIISYGLSIIKSPLSQNVKCLSHRKGLSNCCSPNNTNKFEATDIILKARRIIFSPQRQSIS